MKCIHSTLHRGYGYAGLLAMTLWITPPLTAHAQTATEDNNSYFGAGVRSRPAYDGSKSQRMGFTPILRYYGRPWFARTTQGVLEAGVRTELVPGLAVGAQTAYEAGRSSKEADFLRTYNAADISANASVGGHVEWDTKVGKAPVNLLGRLRQNMDVDRGAQVDLRFSAGVYGGKGVAIGVFVQETWGNSKSARSNYGVSAPETISAELPAFQPESGFLFVAAGLLGSIDIKPRWVISWSAENRRMQGDARRSPLTERLSNYYGSAGLGYRF